MPAHRETCLEQLSELTTLYHGPRHALFHARPGALKLTAALDHHRQLADTRLFKHARRIDGLGER